MSGWWHSGWKQVGELRELGSFLPETPQASWPSTRDCPALWLVTWTVARASRMAELEWAAGRPERGGGYTAVPTQSRRQQPWAQALGGLT